MKNKQIKTRYQALINLMYEINDECNVFQDNPELEDNDKNDIYVMYSKITQNLKITIKMIFQH
jgi:hypothetical protein